MEQVEQIWESKEWEDKEKTHATKSQVALYKQLNEYEDSMRNLEERNKRLVWELDGLRRGDDSNVSIGIAVQSWLFRLYARFLLKKR